MFWAFAQGASNSILKDLEAAKASQQEMDTWKKRTEFAEELQRKAEEQKAKNRIIASGINLNKGVAYEQTVGGESREIPLSETALQPMRQQAALLAEEKRLKDARAAEKFELDRLKAETSAESNRAQAENARSSAAARSQRLPAQIEADKARAESLRRAPSGEEKEAKRDTQRAEAKLDKEVTSAYSAMSRNENPAIAEAARRIRFATNLSAAEKLEALTELMDATE